MSEILALAESSLMTDLTRLEVISNNLANANTPGFRRDLAVTRGFDQLLAGELGPAGVHAVAWDRLGAALQARTSRMTDQRPGSLRFTGHDLDVAVEGDGFLELRGPEGPVFSRMGALSLDPTGLLVGADGLPVMGTGGEIQLTTTTPRIDQDGSIWERDVQVGQLKLVRFDAPEALEKLGSGLYRGGEPLEAGDDAPLHVRQGHLESSNVSVTSEMVTLIELVRRFETTQRVVQSYDESMTQALRTIGDL